MAQMQEEFTIVKWGLEKRGMSVEQLKAEMEAENKVWDLPIGSSPVFGNPKAPITIVEFSDFNAPIAASASSLYGHLDAQISHPDQAGLQALPLKLPHSRSWSRCR